MSDNIETRLREIEERIKAAESCPGEMYWAEEMSPVINVDVPFLVEQVRRLMAENERLLHHRKTDMAFVREARAERDKLRDWKERVIKYHGYLTGVITEAEAGE